MDIFYPFKAVFRFFGSEEVKEELPERIYFVIISPARWCTDKKFSKAWEKLIVKNRDRLVPQFCDELPWQYAMDYYISLEQYIGHAPNPCHNDFSSEQIIEYFSESPTSHLGGLMCATLVQEISDSLEIYVAHLNDVTDEVHEIRGRYFNRQRRFAAVAEAIDSGKMPGFCPSCGTSFRKYPPDSDGDCDKCGYPLDADDLTDEEEVKEMLTMDIESSPATIGDLISSQVKATKH